MRKITFLPNNDSTNGWSRILPPRTPRPALVKDIRSDWLVIGAGFAGLAAARRLAENRPDETVALIDAHEAGENASGRNSGFAIDLPHNVGSSLDELEGSHRFIRLSRAAIDHLEKQVSTHGIDCQWSRRGKYHTAVSERGASEVLEPFSKELTALGEPWRWLDSRALAAEIGTGYHHAAVYTPGCVLMNPAALVRGLADSLPANVSLYEHSPVVEADYRNGIRVVTPKGSAYAPRMILCVNGLAEAFGFFDRQLLRFAAHASLTRALTPAERRTLGGKDDWGVTPANAFVSTTMRLTQDQRILIRHELVYDPRHRIGAAQHADVRKRHEQEFRNRFPMLPGVTFDHTWTGYVCLSRNHAPGFGRIAPNVWAAVCQNAVGVTKGTIGGLLAADMATGVDSPLIADMESLGKPETLPPRPFLDIGVHARTRWDLWRVRHEK